MNAIERYARALSIALLLGAILPASLLAQPRLLPTPAEVRPAAGAFAIPDSLTIAVASGSAEDLFAAGLLRDELAAWGRRRVGIAGGEQGEVVLRGAPGKSGAGDESYELDVAPKQITLRGGGSAGLFYGVQTLRQLVQGRSIPCLHVSDRPALRWRGVLEDVSRGPVPTLATLKRRVEILSQLKVNLYALYFENTLRYAAHPGAARPEGSVSQDELRELCAYAERFHVTIVPVQQSLGHMGAWLSLARYRSLAESPGSDILSVRNTATLPFLSSLFDELARSTSGPWVHVGGDEALTLDGQRQELASGPSRDAYLAFVKEVRALLAARGKQMVIWGDGLESMGARLENFPKDVTVASWSYQVLSDYSQSIEPFRKAGVPFFVCPGAWNWRRLFPDLGASIRNIRTFTRQGRQAGAVGQITCTWGDGGEALFPLAWYPVTCGAAAAWQSTDLDSVEVRRSFDWVLFRAEGTDVADAQQAISRVHGSIDKATGLIAEPQFLWLDPFHPINRGVLAKLETVAPEIALAQGQALDALGRARTRATRNRDLLDYLDFSARRIETTALRASFPTRARSLYLEALAAGASEADRKRAASAIEAIRDLCGDNLNRVLESRGAFERLWTSENHPAGLSRVLAQYDHDADMWLDGLEQFRMLRLVVATGRTLPPASDVGFAP